MKMPLGWTGFAKGHVEQYETVTNWPALFQQFRGAVKGAILPENQLYRKAKAKGF
jgi:hypothetical protein